VISVAKRLALCLNEQVSSDPQKPSTWKPYKKGMCEGCWAGCCTLPLEVSAFDLLRLELITEDEAASSLKKVSKKLMKAGYVRQFFSRTGVFIMEQRGGRDCVFLGETDRRCTVYEKRPEVCPRPTFCPERKITEVNLAESKNSGARARR
jgi:Fe-S-cluster containining protein